MSLASFIKLFQILKFKILSTTPYKLIDLEILVLCQCNLCYNVQLKSKASSTPHLVPLYPVDDWLKRQSLKSQL